jgi:hypothetical protein
MLGGDFPRSSGVAGQAAEQHPGAADHGGRAPAQQIQDFRPETGRRARRLSFNGNGFARCGLVCQ